MQNHNKFKIWSGLLIVAVAIFIAKYLFLSKSIAGSWFSLIGLKIAKQDTLALATISLLVVLIAISKSKLIKIIFTSLSLMLLIYFLLDTVFIIYLDSRLNIFGIVQWFPEIANSKYFLLGWPEFLVAIIILWLISRSYQGSKLGIRYVLIFGLINILIFSIPLDNSYSFFVKQYSLSGKSSEILKFRQNSASIYTPATLLKAFEEYSSSKILSLPEELPSVIFLVVESLSTVDSIRGGGVNNYLPKLDKISEEGVYFKNFFANYGDSEGGQISFYFARPPLFSPISNRNNYKHYLNHRSVVDEFSKLGYFTEHLVSSDLTFMSMDQLVRAAGFDQAYGKESLSKLKEAPVFAFGFPSDQLLFEEALTQIDQLDKTKKKYLLSISTGSSHLPYVDPLGRGNTEENVWDFVDQSILWFYNQLDSRGFFSKGILIITGDHRKKVSATDLEFQIFGDSLLYRIPLIIVGKGVAKSKLDNRLFQQADLFPMLSRAIETNLELSEFVISLDPYSLYWNTPFSDFNFKVAIQEGNSIQTYTAAISDTLVKWNAPSPSKAAQIEDYIHHIRAVNQYQIMQLDESCKLKFSDFEYDNLSNGLEMRSFSGIDITGLLDQKSPRFLGNQIVSEINILEDTSNRQNQLSYELRGGLIAPDDGYYWFRITSEEGVCFAINRELLIDANRDKVYMPNEVKVHLEKGIHRLDLRYFNSSKQSNIKLEWVTPVTKEWMPVPIENFIPPKLKDN